MPRNRYHFNWHKSADRGHSASSIVAQTAADETEAYLSLKRIKRRASYERKELKDKAKRAAITMPKLKFME